MAEPTFMSAYDGPSWDKAIAFILSGSMGQTAQQTQEAADRVAEDRERIENMQIKATGAAPGTQPTVKKQIDPDGNLVFTISIPGFAPDTLGPAGESAYQAAQKGGYTGTAQDFYGDLAGVKDLGSWLASL